MKHVKFASRRVLRRKIEDQRDTIARLVDTAVEKDKEIAELRELLGSVDIELRDIIAYAKQITDIARVTQGYIRHYREEYGVMPGRVGKKCGSVPDDDWDGK